jgi:glutamine---fructose-6-phosphate transaminase (isomerizing)
MGNFTSVIAAALEETAIRATAIENRVRRTRAHTALVSTLSREIEEQPRALSCMLEQWSTVCAVADAVRAFAPEWIQIAARGTSDNAARYAQYLFGVNNGLAVGLASPSLLTIYQSFPRVGRALTIGISQSGQSPDVVAVLAEARRQGGATLAITNDSQSPLAAISEHRILLTTGREESVAATKTYTNQLLALAMLSAALDGEDGVRRTQLARVPRAVGEALAGSAPFIEGARPFRDATRFLVLARGFNYATAHEVALKIKEMSYVVAEAYSTADFLHGPVAMLEEAFPVVVVAPSGRSAAEIPALLDLLERRQARLIAISDDPATLARAEVAVPFPADLPEWLSPIVAVVPGQILARSIAIAVGRDPDRPRGLSKVTQTR